MNLILTLLFFQTNETYEAVKSLGFPIVIALVFAFALYKLGVKIISDADKSNEFQRTVFTQIIKENTVAMTTQTEELKAIKDILLSQQQKNSRVFQMRKQA
jgi:hypothetical protein